MLSSIIYTFYLNNVTMYFLSVCLNDCVIFPLAGGTINTGSLNHTSLNRWFSETVNTGSLPYGARLSYYDIYTPG